MDENLKKITEWRQCLADVDYDNFMNQKMLKKWADDKINLACESAMAYKVTPKSPRRIWKPNVYKVSRNLERLFEEK